MSKEIPFDEDVMTLIMGLEGPEEPGQHGRKTIPAPQMDAIDLATQIRDLCEDFLQSAGKSDNEAGKSAKKQGDEEADSEEEIEEE